MAPGLVAGGQWAWWLLQLIQLLSIIFLQELIWMMLVWWLPTSKLHAACDLLWHIFLSLVNAVRTSYGLLRIPVQGWQKFVSWPQGFTWHSISMAGLKGAVSKSAVDIHVSNWWLQHFRKDLQCWYVQTCYRWSEKYIADYVHGYNYRCNTKSSYHSVKQKTWYSNQIPHHQSL